FRSRYRDFQTYSWKDSWFVEKVNTRYSKLFREGYESFTHLKQYDLQGIFTALASRMPTLDLYYQLMIF
ncbi:hypothetical protein, partial [Salmonella enterica]|uniref:hypothetical protein n=2 Tax=Salmonella enterica TaxID=28901 RepID=UPI0009B17250